MTVCRTRLAAGTATLAFVVGTIVIPVLHLVFHSLPHDHDGGEIHYHLQFGDDQHHTDDDHDHPIEDGGDHHHDDADDHRHAIEHEADHHHGDHDRGHEPFDLHHGDGSNAHFSLALGDASASPIDLVIVGATKQGRVVPSPDVFHASAHVSVARFRGPPVAI